MVESEESEEYVLTELVGIAWVFEGDSVVTVSREAEGWKGGLRRDWLADYK